VSRSSRLYILGVSACFWGAVVVLIGCGCGATLPSIGEIAPLVGLAIAAEALMVRQSEKPGADVLSFSATAHIAIAILFGPIPAALVAAVAVIVVDGLRLQARLSIAMNSAMFGLSILVAGYAFEAVGGSHGSLTSGAAGPVLVLVATRFLVNTFLYSGLIHLLTGAPLRRVVWDDVLDSFAPGLGEGCLGVLVAFGYTDRSWIVLPFLVPLLAALYQSKSNFERLQTETANVLESLAQVIDERDPSTAQHSERVAEYVERFVRAAGLGERESARLISTARFHDLGKVVVDVATLSKEGRLDEAELRAIRRHPRLSARLLAPFHFATEMSLYAELHHERYDGRGYYRVPQREIPVEAHVLIVADSYDAMTSARAYRPALTEQEAVQELRDKAGSQFHPLVAHAFAAMIEGDPVATAMGEAQLIALRAEFSRVNALRMPSLTPLVEPGPIGVVLAATTAVCWGIEPVPRPLVGLLVVATAAAAGWWLRWVLSMRRRRARLAALLDSGAGPAMALSGAGVACWGAWLELDDSAAEYTARPDGEAPPAADLEETCLRALRHEEPFEAVLESETCLIAAAESDGPRLVVGCPRRPSDFERSLIATAMARTAEPGEARDPVVMTVEQGDRRTDKALRRALVSVRLGAFENVRLAGGQLLAERVVADAEQRLRQLIRSSDQLVKVDEDSFALCVWVHDSAQLETVRGRILSALAELRSAIGAAVHQDPRLRVLAGVLGDVDWEREAS
jgi:hypothetical protein